MNAVGLGLVGLLLAIIDFFGASPVLERWLATAPARAKSLMPWRPDRPQTSLEWVERAMPLALIGGVVMSAALCVMVPPMPGQHPLQTAVFNFAFGSLFLVFLVFGAIVSITLYLRIWFAVLAQGKSAFDRILPLLLMLIVTPIFVPIGLLCAMIGLEVLVVGFLFSLIFKLRIPRPLACLGLALGGISLLP